MHIEVAVIVSDHRLATLLDAGLRLRDRATFDQSNVWPLRVFSFSQSAGGIRIKHIIMAVSGESRAEYNYLARADSQSLFEEIVRNNWYTRLDLTGSYWDAVTGETYAPSPKS